MVWCRIVPYRVVPYHMVQWGVVWYGTMVWYVWQWVWCSVVWYRSSGVDCGDLDWWDWRLSQFRILSLFRCFGLSMYCYVLLKQLRQNTHSVAKFWGLYLLPTQELAWMLAERTLWHIFGTFQCRFWSFGLRVHTELFIQVLVSVS